jgi:hypothetical protein
MTKPTIQTKTADEKKQAQKNFNLVTAAFGIPPRPLYHPVSRSMKRYVQEQGGRRIALLTHAELEKVLRLDGLTTTEDELKSGIRLADGSRVRDTLSTGFHEFKDDE